MPRSRRELARLGELERIVAARAVSVAFQPIVELDSGRVVGYEALARGAQRSLFNHMGEVFTFAHRNGLAVDLDWVCRASALRAAVAAGLPRELALFLNVEPATLRTSCPDDLAGVVAEGLGRLTVVAELTERRLADDPAAVLNAVTVGRAEGLGMAVDDVGAERATLAMMPLLQPDVIKLDLSLVQDRPGLRVARTVHGVLAEAERTGAVILAEGIETPRHRAVARAMGATLGQGWSFGRPGPLPARWPSTGDAVALLSSHPGAEGTPYEVVTRHRPARAALRPLLQSLSRHLELRSSDPAEPGVLVSSFMEAENFVETVQRRYTELASRAVMVAAVARDMPLEPAPGVRGSPLADDDPVVDEWAVTVIGAHFAAALVARIRPGHDPHAEGAVFDYALTYDRRLVIAAAQSLVQRLDTHLPLAHPPRRNHRGQRRSR